MEKQKRMYEQVGYLPPIDLLTDGECRSIMQEYLEACSKHPELSPQKVADPATLERYWLALGVSKIWFKSAHTVMPSVAQVAGHPRLLNVLSRLLGSRVMLWAAQIIQRMPGEVHQFHVDVETNYWNSVNVWIGLENCGSESSVMMVSHTHQLELDPSLPRSERFINGNANVQAILEHAKVKNTACELVRPMLDNGQAFFFNGAAWHGSENNTALPRTALLLQYTVENQPVKIPTTFRAPVEWHSLRPPCVTYETTKLFD